MVGGKFNATTKIMTTTTTSPSTPVSLSSPDGKSPNQFNDGASFACPECGRLYKLKSSLRNHQKWECGKDPQFQCPFCVYKAKQKMHIGRHMERMHKEKCIKIEGDKIIEMKDDENSNKSNSNI